MNDIYRALVLDVEYIIIFVDTVPFQFQLTRLGVIYNMSNRDIKLNIHTYVRTS